MKTILLNPFKKYSERTLLGIGVVMLLIGSFLGFYFQARYDGVLDLHFVKNIQWQEPLFDNLINIFSLSSLLFIVGKYLNRKTRLIDILNTVLIAQLPFYLMTLTNINGFMVKSSEKLLTVLMPQGSNVPVLNPQEVMPIINDSLGFILFSSATSILVLVWVIILLYNGFKIAVNAKGTKAIVLFIAVILLAEILSKLILYFL